MTPIASKTLGRMNVNLSLEEPIISGDTLDPSIRTEQTITSMPKRAAVRANISSQRLWK